VPGMGGVAVGGSVPWVVEADVLSLSMETRPSPCDQGGI
jgi:hypothetical protein